MARYDFAAPRLFLTHQPFADGAAVNLDEGQTNYLRNVLRLKCGDAVLTFNGQDGEWRARIVEAHKKKSAIRLEERLRPQEFPMPLDYCFAPLKHARLDYMIQKAVEMGASRLCPVITQRTQVTRVNLHRMRANAIEAAEQCGALSLPDIAPEISFNAFLASWPETKLLIFCDEDAPLTSPAAALAARAQESRDGMGVFIGPEGGFDPKEREALLARRNIVRINLGSRILRADTAAVAALAIAQTILGDWR